MNLILCAVKLVGSSGRLNILYELCFVDKVLCGVIHLEFPRPYGLPTLLHIITYCA
jgi:hypothetical protein